MSTRQDAKPDYKARPNEALEENQMAYTINTNIAGLQAQDYLRITTDFQNKTINRVTSGLRIVNSGDDAAGLAIANSPGLRRQRYQRKLRPN